jgi:hypothetical protein
MDSEAMQAGDRVKVATGGPVIDGIVFEVLHGPKVVVAVRDPARGPVLRTFPRRALEERAEAGPDDRALQLLIRRMTPAMRGAGAGRAGAGPGGGGHRRAAPHRTTGR